MPNVMGREFPYTPEGMAAAEQYSQAMGMRDGGPMGFRPVGMFLGGVVRKILAESEQPWAREAEAKIYGSGQESQGPDNRVAQTGSSALDSFRREFGREPRDTAELQEYMISSAGGPVSMMRDGGMMGFRPVGMARGGVAHPGGGPGGSGFMGASSPLTQLFRDHYEGPRGSPRKGYDDPDSEYYHGDEKMAEYAEGKRLADLRRAQPGYYDLPTEQERAQGPVQLDFPSLQEQLDVEPASAPTGSTNSLALDSFRREFEREPRDIAELQEYIISRAGSPRLMRDGGMMGFRPLGMQAGGVPVADVAPDVRAIFQGLVDATQSGSTQDVAAYIESNRQDLNDMVSMMMLPQGQADFITNTINSFAPPPVPQMQVPPQGMSDFPGYEPETGDFYSPQQEDTMPMPPDGYLADPGFSMSPPPAATGSTDPGFSMSPPSIPDYGVDNIGRAGGGLMSLRRR